MKVAVFRKSNTLREYTNSLFMAQRNREREENQFDNVAKKEFKLVIKREFFSET
jgi:hypothetical protein